MSGRSGSKRRTGCSPQVAPAPTHGGTALTTALQYDPVGNRSVVVDANGQVTTYGYCDNAGCLRRDLRLTSVIVALGISPHLNDA